MMSTDSTLTLISSDETGVSESGIIKMASDNVDQPLSSERSSAHIEKECNESLKIPPDKEKDKEIIIHDNTDTLQTSLVDELEKKVKQPELDSPDKSMRTDTESRYYKQADEMMLTDISKGQTMGTEVGNENEKQTAQILDRIAVHDIIGEAESYNSYITKQKDKVEDLIPPVSDNPTYNINSVKGTVTGHLTNEEVVAEKADKQGMGEVSVNRGEDSEPRKQFFDCGNQKDTLDVLEDFVEDSSLNDCEVQDKSIAADISNDLQKKKLAVDSCDKGFDDTDDEVVSKERLLVETNIENKTNGAEITKFGSDLSREREVLARNVFDVFPVSLTSQTRSTEETTSSISKPITESVRSVDMNTAQSTIDVQGDITLNISKNNLEEEEGGLDRDLKLDAYQNEKSTETEISKSEHKYSDKEKSDLNEQTKAIVKGSKSKKEFKQHHNAIEKDLPESEILKKAKEKYNLKELRISLHTDEVKECEATSVSGQNDKTSSLKVPKLKQTNDDCISDKLIKDVEKVSSDEKHQSNSLKDDLLSQEKGKDQLHNSDSVKPLKKRGRRGFEDLQEGGKNIGRPVLLDSSSESLDKTLQGNDSQLVPSDAKVTKNDLTSTLQSESHKNEQTHSDDSRKKRGKKGKRKSNKSKHTNKTKKSETTSIAVGQDKVTDEIVSESVGNEKLDTSIVSVESENIPSTLQLKKYPGRSCKLRNQLPQIPLKPKKIKIPLKSKISEESVPKSNLSDIKIKKKRKRKVKPWSWGNEKKKYKPKAKIVIEEQKETENVRVMSADQLESDTHEVTILGDNSIEASVETCHTVANKWNDVDTAIVNKVDTTIVSKADSAILTKTCNNKDVEDCNKVECAIEKNDLLSINSGPKDITDIKDVEKSSKNICGRPKKKAKRGRKSRKELLNISTLENKGNEQLMEGSEDSLANAACEQNVQENTIQYSNTEIVQQTDCDTCNETTTNNSVVHSESASENLIIESTEHIPRQEDHGMSENQQNVSQEIDLANNSADKEVEVPKRKRGRPGRPRKGEGKGKSKKRKLESSACPPLEANEQVNERDDLVFRNLEAPNAVPENLEPGIVNDDGNNVINADNEIHVDNYPHVSPDSGIQSLAGSPAGNESPNSVIINIENSNNGSNLESSSVENSSADHDSKLCTENVAKQKGETSTSDDHESHFLNASAETKVNETDDTVDRTNSSEKTGEILTAESDPQRSINDSTTGKCNVNNDSAKDLSSFSPSKKKNRAKFLQLHKTSTLLQKGRLPTAEEKEKRLDDKFDYPEKKNDTISACPAIDLYSQHMNSFQVTHGNCDRIGSIANPLETEFSSDYGKPVQKTAKKSHSKHKSKSKRKSTASKSRTSIFETISDLQGQVESLINDPCNVTTAISTLTTVVSTPSSVISEYSPVFHTSSILTPVTSTLSSVAMTDTVTTCLSGAKPISSVLETATVVPQSKDSVSFESDAVSMTENKVSPDTNKESSESHEVIQTNDLKPEDYHTIIPEVEPLPLKKKRGRPPLKKKSVVAVKTAVAVKSKLVNKAKKGISSPSTKNLLQQVPEKKNRGRPKGSKNKDKSLKEREKSVGNMGPTGQQADEIKSKVNKPKKLSVSPAKDRNSLVEKVEKHIIGDENVTNPSLLTIDKNSTNLINTMMEWRESSVLGHDKEEKKKRGPGRPRKHPLVPGKSSPKILQKKKVKSKSFKQCDIDKESVDAENVSESVLKDSSVVSVDDIPLPPVFKDDDLGLLDDSVKQLPKIRKSKLHPMLKGKKGRKKGTKTKNVREQSIDIIDDDGGESEDLMNMTELQPARSVSSHDSDTSGAGSSLGSKSFQVQMWMDMSKLHKRKKSKQKLRYFRSKHKNIIDPVFIAQVDCIIDDFPQLSISPPSETYLKVRPGEVPLPSIFKIVRINIKKKKKDRLFVFEKAKPLKPKNDLESGPKDKIKLGRKIGDHLMDLSDISDQQHLPPKKRHKLFSGLEPDDGFHASEANGKPEKRKAGRPRKVRHPSTDRNAPYPFGEVHKAKQGFEMGRDTSETLASFASVAAQSCQSPGSSFSPDKSPPSFSPISSKLRESRSDSKHSVKSSNKVETLPTNYNTIISPEKSPPSLSAISPKIRESRADKQQNTKSSNKVETISTSPTIVSNSQVSEVCDSDDNPPSLSCNKCSELQASTNEGLDNDARVNSPSVVSNKHLNRKVKRLKRKYRKSKKFTKVKRKVSRPVEIVETEDSMDIDLDSSVRSVCSESEPLPTFHLDKRKHGGSDSDDEILTEKRPKLLKRRRSGGSQDSDTAGVRKQTGPYNQKKKYQKAGLYSDSYKDDEKNDSKEATSSYFTFDLPLHFGQHQLKNMITDFQLPYDVWWLHFNDMLPKKGDGKQYRRIRNNIYVDARPSCRYEAHACNCKKPLNPAEKGCGEDCINRLVYTECSPSLCPCYDQCSNQSIQKHQFAAGLQKFLTKDRGFGVRTTKPIKICQLIVEYCGEVVSEQEFRRRMTDEYSQDRNHYCLNLDGGMVIDGYRKGNIARFVNHSCEPNCEMQKWNVDGIYHMCLFALRDIEPAEELVYDYNFQSFNLDAQQLCQCGSENCRGIIGGKRQWFNGQGKSGDKSTTGKKIRHLKDKRKSKSKQDKNKDKNKKTVIAGYNPSLPISGSQPIPPYFSYPIKPLPKKDRIFARKNSIFLVRNFDRIRGMRHRLDQDSYKVNKDDADYIKGTHFTKRDVFIAQLTALKTSRSMKTRRLTVAEEDTELGKMARIAGVCKEIYSAITTAKDEEGNLLTTDLYHLPSKKKHPRYYQVIEEPIDLTMMEKKILSGTYQSVELFEKDMTKLFQNVDLYCGKKSAMGVKIQELRMIFSNAKREGMAQIQELLGPDTQSDSQTGTLSDVDIQVSTPTTSISSESDISEFSDNKGEWLQGEEEEEEIIRCICGIYKDEGLMIQCDKCYIWQHTDCMRVQGDIGNYLCEQCNPRPVNKEVELVPTSTEDDTEASDDGNRYFMTLMRDDMQIRLGSCVYVMKENQSRRYSYKKSGGLDKDRMDIFRIERLWKNRKGDKFAFGHMYVRPHETFHEPNRKFFPNEVFRTPLYEMFHLESITGYCCVLDHLTYCKGKPKGCRDEDLYICEYRMDKTLHLFYKISPKQRCPVNTRSYCFEMYEKRLNPKRTYSPHEVPESYKRNWREKSTGSSDDNPPDKKPVSDEEEDVPLVRVKQERRKEKRERVNKLVDFLSKGKLSPSKKRTDLTYLLTDKSTSCTGNM